MAFVIQFTAFWRGASVFVSPTFGGVGKPPLSNPGNGVLFHPGPVERWFSEAWQ